MSFLIYKVCNITSGESIQVVRCLILFSWRYLTSKYYNAKKSIQWGSRLCKSFFLKAYLIDWWSVSNSKWWDSRYKKSFFRENITARSSLSQVAFLLRASLMVQLVNCIRKYYFFCNTTAQNDLKDASVSTTKCFQSPGSQGIVISLAPPLGSWRNSLSIHLNLLVHSLLYRYVGWRTVWIIPWRSGGSYF